MSDAPSLFPFLAVGDRCSLVFTNGRVCNGTVLDLDARNGQLHWVRVESDAPGEGPITAHGHALAVWRSGEPMQPKAQVIETQMNPADLKRLLHSGG